MTSSNPTPEEIMENAMFTKEVMDSVILDKQADTALFTPKDYWNGSYYEDEDGYAISEAEAQENTDNSNRIWAKYHGR